MVERLGELRIGDPCDEANDIGPVAFAAHYERVLGHIERAKASGATLAVRRVAARRAGPRLLRRADAVHRRHRRHADRPRGGLRPGHGDADLVRPRRRRRPGERLGPGPDGERVHPRPAGRPPAGRPAAGGLRLRQRHRPPSPGLAVRRLEVTAASARRTRRTSSSPTRRRRRSPSRCPPTSRTGPDQTDTLDGRSMPDNSFNHAPYDKPVWGSDVMVDALRQLDLPYIALNPGSSFRGLHDSLVNYAGDEMQMIECPHEKIAVALAHGYAKASGKPMGVILHDLVGLLQGTMGVYYAYIDRAPVLILGGSGPADQSRRRPYIDWIHSANVQGQAVREFTKWDHEPRSIESVPDVLARAYRVATTGPQGPTYVALDAGLQEDQLEEPVSVDHVAALAAAPSPVAPDPAALRALAQELCDAAPSGDGARLPRPRPAVVPHPRGAGRAGRHRRRGHPLAAELPEQAPALRQRHRRRRRRRLRAVRRRQGHGQARPTAPTGWPGATSRGSGRTAGCSRSASPTWASRRGARTTRRSSRRTTRSPPTPRSPCRCCWRSAGGSSPARARPAPRSARRGRPS